MQHATPNPTWPVLTTYGQEQLARTALPLGGIGTGTVSLGGRGDLRDWEVMNRPAKGFTPADTFFCLYTARQGQKDCRLLEGPVWPPFDDSDGYKSQWYGLPRFRTAAFRAAYPFGQVLLEDPQVPVNVRIEAFNPLVPCDAATSGMPVAILRFVLENPTASQVDASVCGNLNNFIGNDGTTSFTCTNSNTFHSTEGLQGIFMASEDLSDDAEQYGNMAIVTAPEESVSYRTAWKGQTTAGATFPNLIEFWRDFAEDGTLHEENTAGQTNPTASVSTQLTLAPRSSVATTFVLGWWFPNRKAWMQPQEQEVTADAAEYRVGNYYTTQYADAWDAASQAYKNLDTLETRTERFVSGLCDSDIPHAVKEAALYNLSSLRSQTCFRTEDGNFFGWEGCSAQWGCCPGSCTHVWNYEQATAFLFGDLAKSMREVEFNYATTDRGLMSYRVKLPLNRAQEHGLAAADGQMGCIMKLYRDWQLSGDDAMLQRLWPKARKALEFAWIPGGWDADKDGVMEGVQHNTTDLEFYGPNPLTGVWYLGALRAAEEMAEYLGEVDFAQTCRELYHDGTQWIDDNLFNGEYYEQELRTPASKKDIPAGLTSPLMMKTADVQNPPQQPLDGCMTDQLVGQFLANVCNLGNLLQQDHIHTALNTIMRYNFRADLYDHFNPIRTFALQDERALIWGSWPNREMPESPCFRFFEVWTGVEYATACLMIQYGLTEDAQRIFTAVRERFDGRRRNPFNEPECGHHYARAMSSWAGIPGWTGFHYSAPAGILTLAPSREHNTQALWSNGHSWGVYTQQPHQDRITLTLHVYGGTELHLRKIILTAYGTYELDEAVQLAPEQSLSLDISPNSYETNCVKRFVIVKNPD